MAQPKAPAGQRYVPPSRAGKRGVPVYLTPEQWRHLHKLAIDQDLSMQELMEQALAPLFEAQT
jgi:hypothetical protein